MVRGKSEVGFTWIDSAAVLITPQDHITDRLSHYVTRLGNWSFFTGTFWLSCTKGI